MRRELLLGAGHRRDKLLSVPGHEQWEGLTTLDINPMCDADVVWDLEQLPLPFEADSFDEIHAYETIEHLGRQGDAPSFFRQFTEFHRILKPDGLLFATVPDWRSDGAWGDPSHTRVINAMTLAFLSQKEYAVQVGRTAMSDYRHLYTADFETMYARAENEVFRFVIKAVK